MTGAIFISDDLDFDFCFSCLHLNPFQSLVYVFILYLRIIYLFLQIFFIDYSLWHLPQMILINSEGSGHFLYNLSQVIRINQEAKSVVIRKIYIFIYEYLKIKHCQRHNGPEGWVHFAKVSSWGHITSSNTNRHQLKISTNHQHLR